MSLNSQKGGGAFAPPPFYLCLSLVKSHPIKSIRKLSAKSKTTTSIAKTINVTMILTFNTFFIRDRYYFICGL